MEACKVWLERVTLLESPAASTEAFESVIESICLQHICKGKAGGVLAGQGSQHRPGKGRPSLHSDLALILQRH